MVRHGQASYMAEDYDKLSPLGEEQARRLGQFWVRHNIVFDRVLCGPAKRHARTLEIAADTVQAAGLPWPEAQRIPAFDEFDAFQVMKLFVPVLLERDAAVRALHDEFRAKQESPEAGRLLQKLFEEVARHWCSGEIEVSDVETWSGFRTRVREAVDAVRDTSGSGANVVVFTSGGPIAATVAQTLDLSPRTAIEFLWLSRNCSYSEFLFSNGRFSMHSFNSIPHLDERGLLTYR